VGRSDRNDADGARMHREPVGERPDREAPRGGRAVKHPVALDAAGITLEEVLRDAPLGQEAIDSYEVERKQVEAEWARKAEENLQIQAELERVKTQFMDRLRRNLDGVAREKATFGNWLTMKQQEWRSMAEAVDLCTKSPVQEPTREGMSVTSLAEARGKPV
jgi:hypothetical protein